MSEISGNWLARRKARKAATEAAYAGLMQAALAPALYAEGVVPDTFDGRFHMVTLHGGLAINCLLASGDSEAAKLADRLNTAIFAGFDHALRERGAGDSSIARKARKFGERYYGLIEAMMAAFEAGDTQQNMAELSDVLVRNGVTDIAHAPVFAQHLWAVRAQLQTCSPEQLARGTFAYSA